MNTNFELHFSIRHSWQDNEGRLEIVWMERNPAIESMLVLITCNCGGALCGDDCQCSVLSLECTGRCNCTGNCENVKSCENEEGSDGQEREDRDKKR